MSALDLVLLLLVAGLAVALVATAHRLLGERDAARRAAAQAEHDLEVEVLQKETARGDLQAVKAIHVEVETARAAKVLEYEARIAALTPAERGTVSPDQLELMRKNKCVHCGGVHDIACPRIAAITFRGDGQTPESVRFWREWPTERVTFLEDLDEELVAGS